jgi:hypothetical protein
MELDRKNVPAGRIAALVAGLEQDFLPHRRPNSSAPGLPSFLGHDRIFGRRPNVRGEQRAAV